MLPLLRVLAVLLALAGAAPLRAEPALAQTVPAAGKAASEGDDPWGSSLPGRGLAADDPLRAEAAGFGEPQGEGLLGSLLRMLLVLALVLATVYLTLNFGLRKLMRLGAPLDPVLKVHERLALDPKRGVYLVEVAGEYLLLGAGEGEVRLLTRIEPERAREALARKPAARPAVKPFWERLVHKPPLGGGSSSGSTS